MIPESGRRFSEKIMPQKGLLARACNQFVAAPRRRSASIISRVPMPSWAR